MTDLATNQTNYIVIPPSTPNDEALIKKISGLLADIEDIKEAHLPSLIEFGTSASDKRSTSKPALFVVVDDGCDRAALYELLDKKLNGGMFKRKRLEIKIVSEDFVLLQSVRDTQCLIGWRD